MVRSRKLGYDSKPKEQIFEQRTIHNEMSPHGITVRESRDSDESPNSTAIIIALDVTGSMGNVPHQLVKNGLPHIMESIIEAGIQNPQVLFLAIGDHTCDEAPLQVGQFEQNDELLDNWLTQVYLEGHGGRNDGESYMLAWYFAAQHTSIDCFEKRGKKGFLFTIGDEPVLSSIGSRDLDRLMGDTSKSGEYQVANIRSDFLLEQAQKEYHCFHLHIQETGSGRRQRVQDEWAQRMSDNMLPVQRHTDVASTIASAILKSAHKEAAKVVVKKKVEKKVFVDDQAAKPAGESAGMPAAQSSKIKDML
jgi:hypothetical protein